MLNIDQIAAHIVRMRVLEALDTGTKARYGDAWIMEAEGVAHLAVPFLRALGWRDEQIAVEWYHPEWQNGTTHIDVCVFKNARREKDNCCYLIEAKRRKDAPEIGDSDAFTQARDYAKALDPEKPRPFVITNGIQYEMYDYDKQKNDYAKSASADFSGLQNRPAVNLDSLHLAQLPGEIECREKPSQEERELNRGALELCRRMSPACRKK